jgi:fucose 4-O-acetylase-like acetyltransferase
MWTVWRPLWLPWPIESYIDGVHNLGEPQSWLFPIFPWTGFAFTGLAVGIFLLSDWARNRSATGFVMAGGGGIGLIYLGRWLDRQPWQIYSRYDFWHTSPAFFLLRVGVLLIIMTGAYLWCRWGAGQRLFSPLVQLGQTSLLVYWVHIEFVYGRLSILPKKLVNIGTASLGLLVIFLGMVLLSMWRTRRRGQGSSLLMWARRPMSAN